MNPNQPIPLTIPANTMADITAMMCDIHNKNIRVFRELMVAEQDFIQHIVDALDKAYILDIRYCTTNFRDDKK